MMIGVKIYRYTAEWHYSNDVNQKWLSVQSWDSDRRLAEDEVVGEATSMVASLSGTHPVSVRVVGVTLVVLEVVEATVVLRRD